MPHAVYHPRTYGPWHVSLYDANTDSMVPVLNCKQATKPTTNQADQHKMKRRHTLRTPANTSAMYSHRAINIAKVRMFLWTSKGCHYQNSANAARAKSTLKCMASLEAIPTGLREIEVRRSKSQ